MLRYRYAELNDKGNRWYVYFYALHPLSGKLERKRIYLNKIRTYSNKVRYAKKLIMFINEKLDGGWNPFVSETHKKQYTLLIEALEFVWQYKCSYIRERSKTEYNQRFKLLKEWLIKTRNVNLYAFEFTEGMALDFMNDFLLVRKIKSNTFNKYLIDYRTFFNVLVKQKYITENPFKAVGKLPTTDKTKQPFTKNEQALYKEYVKKNEYDFYIISMYCYYCAIRPNEITQLKRKDVNIERKVINISANVSKNKRQRIIPIADSFCKDLAIYLEKVPDHFYLCGKGLKPGPEKTAPTRIAEKFREIAKTIGLPEYVFFYSLKDTCADRLMETGFSAKTLRDLFGHSDISITDKYLRGINSYVEERLRTDFPEF